MKIAIIGLGYVGLPLALQFTSSGVDVVGLDVDATKVDSIQKGRSYIKHISDDMIKGPLGLGRLEVSTDFGLVRDVEAVIICVPTPLNRYREPDVSYVLATARAIAPHLSGGQRVLNGELSAVEAQQFHSGGFAGVDQTNGSHEQPTGPDYSAPTHLPQGLRKLVVLESTSYPGTTDEDVRIALEEGSGLTAGVDFNLAFSPEREDPGNPVSKVKAIPKVIGGLTESCRDRALAVYGTAIDHLVPVSSCRAAEATKLLENIFRSVNIALVNELKVIYEAMDIDIWEVIEAAKTKPFGYMPFYPGPGLGGHCIPIDPFYLTWKAREFGQHTRFIELAGEINAGMRRHVVRKVSEALNQKTRSLRASRVLLVGLAYKADVDDMRESPAFGLMDELKACGVDVHYFDPWIPEILPTREHAKWTGTKSVEWNRELISSFDCVVICTAHRSICYRELGEWADCIVDTRNAMAAAGIRGPNISKA